MYFRVSLNYCLFDKYKMDLKNIATFNAELEVIHIVNLIMLLVNMIHTRIFSLLYLLNAIYSSFLEDNL